MSAPHETASAFVRDNTRLRPVPHVPEIVLHVADEAVPLWQATEEELGEMGLPPPFWAFAWAGGQALARHVLDCPEIVAGKRVLDLAAGSGLVGIAAAKAGAVPVVAIDVDAFASAAIILNMVANDVFLCWETADPLDRPAPLVARYDVVLVGDLFYDREIAGRALAFLDRHKAVGSTILVGDPGRAYLPRERLAALATYEVPVIRDLEDMAVKHTTVWELRPA